MPPVISDEALDVLFRDARSQNGWRPKDIDDGVLDELHNIMKWGPTSANGWPMRTVFVRSPEAKAKLAATAMEGNQKKILAAPVTAILANDFAFFERMDTLFPHNPGMAEMFAGNAELAEITALRNGTLQAAYFMIAARALGLDCGPMSGFDNAACDQAFFSETPEVRSNFICSLGYGDPAALFPRLPRPEFDDVCRTE